MQKMLQRKEGLKSDWWTRPDVLCSLSGVFVNRGTWLYSLCDFDEHGQGDVVLVLMNRETWLYSLCLFNTCSLPSSHSVGKNSQLNRSFLS